jgi:phosphopantothenoylcysteine decarboxylase/phosphopantothenate--cysteine ligase
MYREVSKIYPKTQIAVFAAAVADYTPKQKAASKIKKSSGDTNIALQATKDIAYEMGKLKKEYQVNVGFALESDDEEANAKEKLKKKNLDFIVLNSLKDEGAGFAHDTNRITIIDRDNNLTKFELKSKKDVAHDIVNHILRYIQV